MENIQNFGADLFCKISIFHFHVSHIGFHKYPKLKFIFDLLYTPVAHEVLPVSLVDSVTAKVGDEKYILHTLYTSYIYQMYISFLKPFLLFT